jgi:hypothetical protein
MSRVSDSPVSEVCSDDNDDGIGDDDDGDGQTAFVCNGRLTNSKN